MAKDRMMALEELYNLTAMQLTEVIQKGVPIVDKAGVPMLDPETGEVLRAPAPAAYFATAVKFLKDNGIDCNVRENEAIQSLAEKMDFPVDVDDDDSIVQFRR